MCDSLAELDLHISQQFTTNIKLTKATDLESNAFLILLTAASTAGNPQKTHQQLEVNSTLSSQEAVVDFCVFGRYNRKLGNCKVNRTQHVLMCLFAVLCTGLTLKARKSIIYKKIF